MRRSAGTRGDSFDLDGIPSRRFRGEIDEDCELSELVSVNVIYCFVEAAGEDCSAFAVVFEFARLLKCQERGGDKAVINIHFSRFGLRCVQREGCVDSPFRLCTYIRLPLDYQKAVSYKNFLYYPLDTTNYRYLIN